MRPRNKTSADSSFCSISVSSLEVWPCGHGAGRREGLQIHLLSGKHAVKKLTWHRFLLTCKFFSLGQTSCHAIIEGIHFILQALDFFGQPWQPHVAWVDLDLAR